MYTLLVLCIGIFIGWIAKRKQVEFFPSIFGEIKDKFKTKGMKKDEEK